MTLTLNDKSKQINTLKNIINDLTLGKNQIDKGIEKYYSGEFENAIKHYDSAINNYKNNAAAYGLKGQSQIVIKQYENAEKNLLKSINLNSERPQPYYSLILLHIKKENPEKAFYYLNKLLDISPQFIDQIKFIPELNNVVLYKDFPSIQEDQKIKLSYVQKKLKELKYYNGEADGMFRSKTSQAITNFQRDNNLNITGTWDLNTLNKLKYQ